MKGKKNVVYNPNQSEYIVKLKKTNWWWLLLLLLPLLLLLLQIRIPAKINVGVYEQTYKTPVINATTTLTYPDRNFIDFSKFEFFTLDTIQKTQQTEENGKTKFEVSYTLYHKLFHKKDNANITVSGGCVSSASITENYFKMIKNTENQIFTRGIYRSYTFIVVDKKTKAAIPNADVEIESVIGNNSTKTSYKSDARGIVEVQVPACADKLNVIASKYGYSSYSVGGNFSFFNQSENRILPLEEKYSPIEFFVKDLYTKQPIPNSTARIEVENNQLTDITNVDGLGKGMFDSLSNSKTFRIKFTHPAYYDTITQTFKVEDFAKLSEKDRTFFMRPRPGNTSFWNTDKITGQPLEGVKNVVYVNGNYKGDFISNSNGEFVVPGLSPNDKISISATKPGFKENNYSVQNKTVSQLDTKGKRTIPLEIDDTPQNVEPPRENCRVHFSGTLLSDTYIEGHISLIYQVDEYGEYVGEGEYPNAKVAFPNADRTTFDAIAIDKGTRLIIYSDLNFQGSVLLDVKGPALINNVKWKDEARIKDVNKKTFTEPLQSLFPNSCRRWSNSNMNDWSRGSIKIMCNQ